MTESFENSNFGPVSEPEITGESLPKEFALRRPKEFQEGKKVKTAYLKIRKKVKEVRQEYRRVINEEPRSGSGKLVCQNWNLVKNLSVGSPATVTVSNSRSSFNMENIDKEEQEEKVEEDILE